MDGPKMMDDDPTVGNRVPPSLEQACEALEKTGGGDCPFSVTVTISGSAEDHLWAWPVIHQLRGYMESGARIARGLSVSVSTVEVGEVGSSEPAPMFSVGMRPNPNVQG